MNDSPFLTVLGICKILRLDHSKEFVPFLTDKSPHLRLGHFRLKPNQHIEGPVSTLSIIRKPGFLQ